MDTSRIPEHWLLSVQEPRSMGHVLKVETLIDHHTSGGNSSGRPQHECQTSLRSLKASVWTLSATTPGVAVAGMESPPTEPWNGVDQTATPKGKVKTVDCPVGRPDHKRKNDGPLVLSFLACGSAPAVTISTTSSEF
jgi:hypothetical protein